MAKGRSWYIQFLKLIREEHLTWKKQRLNP